MRDKSFLLLFFLTFFCVVIGCDANLDNCNEEVDERYENTSSYIKDQDSLHQIYVRGEYQIQEHIVFERSPLLRSFFRIPSAVITNEGTILISCENRATADDKGDIDILVARKAKTDKAWKIMMVVPNDSLTYGRSMNPVFLIDRKGANGRKGRIYLFVAHMKKQGYAVSQSTSDADIVYKYSDDDGQTWSPEHSLKYLWDTNEYTAAYPSACNGIQLDNGTMLLPTMVVKDENWRSGILKKTTNSDWLFSPTTICDGDNESSVYVDNSERIVLDCRTTDKVHRKYIYDENRNMLSYLTEVPVKHDLKADISKICYGDSTFYLTTYVDTEAGLRENCTLYMSTNGNDWEPVYRLQDGFNGYAYGNVAYYKGRLVVVFEDFMHEDIKLHDISDYKDVFFNKVVVK